MSTVYLARSEGPAGFRREVALKWVPGSAPGFQDLAAHLLREARIVGQIHHPNVVQMVDAGESVEGIYLVMEYVEGGTLATLMTHAASQGGPLPLPISLRIIGDALVGLHAAHELRDGDARHLALVHRDFSPQNILIGVEGEVKLGDFGIAKVEHTSHRTRTGLVKGTVSYMSPEQVRGQELDRRSDLWSAGVVAWELFAGKPFHDKREAIAAAMSTLTGRIPRLRSVRQELPEALEEAVALALTRTKARRYQTALELRERIIEAAGVAPASTEELAAYARQAFASELAARRQRIELGGQAPQTEADSAALTARVPSQARALERVREPGKGRALALVLGLLLTLGVIMVVARAVRPRAPEKSAASADLAARAAPPSPVATSVISGFAAQATPDSAPASATRASGAQRPSSARFARAPAKATPGFAGQPSVGASPSTSPPHDPVAAEAPPSVATPAAPPLADNPYARSRPGSR